VWRCSGAKRGFFYLFLKKLERPRPLQRALVKPKEQVNKVQGEIKNSNKVPAPYSSEDKKEIKKINSKHLVLPNFVSMKKL
jgi:hypothetical protein